MEKTFIGGVMVLTPTQNLTGGKETEELMLAASQVLNEDQPRVVIDLRKIDWINSPGLSALARIHVSCAARGGWMRVARVSTRIKNMLAVTRMIMLFDTFDSADEAAHPDGVKRA